MMLPAADAEHPAVFARKAEELGFESLWLPEHPVIPVNCETRYPLAEDGKIPECYARVADPLVTLACAAAATTRIRLATGICLVPERHPLLLAKEIATLDRYSGGRTMVGVGAGWLREETELFGVGFPRRWLRLKESVLALRELWTKEEAEFHGKTVDFPPVRCAPKPVQKPYPPVFLGAHGEPGLRRVAAWADGWCPLGTSADDLAGQLKRLRQLTEEAGRDPASLEISVFQGVTTESAYADIVERYRDIGVGRVVLALGEAEGPAAFGTAHLYKPGQAAADLERLAEGSIARIR
jgi:probable F420-dependent oxidoreductase